MFKTCAKCKKYQSVLGFWKNSKRGDGYNSYCKKCHDQYRKNNLERNSQLQRDRRQRIRTEIINRYGGQCICCGEKEYKFLAFDHINGGGSKHKQVVGRSMKFLSWIKNNNYPNMLQILCHNCNQAKGAWGKCPHET